jgi:hypothetical protein
MGQVSAREGWRDSYEITQRIDTQPLDYALYESSAQSVTFDRIAFAYSLLETGLRICPEKDQDSDRLWC